MWQLHSSAHHIEIKRWNVLYILYIDEDCCSLLVPIWLIPVSDISIKPQTGMSVDGTVVGVVVIAYYN